MNKFIHSIKFKFILAFGLCIALLVATGAFAIISLSRLSNNMNDMYHLNTVPISVLDTVKYNHAVVRLLTRRLQLAIDDNDTKQSDQIAQEILDTKNIMNQAWNEYYPDLLSNDAERSVAQKVAVYIPQFNNVVTDILSAYKANDLERLDADCIKLANIGDVLDALLRENIEVNLAMARNFAERADANSRTLLGIAIALVSLGVLLSIVATFSLMRAISRPLAMAVSIAKEIAAGRLDNTIPVTSKDEFGQLLVSLQAMDNHLSSVVREIKHSTESVSVASQEIAGGNLDLSARTEQQAASLEQTAASVTELTETVKQNADSALQASSLANDATDLANAGNLAVQAMVETVDRINTSSNKIAEITGLIEGIAFQTNILALNAAVEAARAGEQGRGFAVVASEVRTLAQRSSSAAKEIKTLIDASVTLTRDGSKQAEGVGGTMEQVREAIQKVSSIVSEIATASAEQSQGIEQVHQAVSQMDDVTQQNAALVEQSAAAAQSLEEQAMHLKQVVAVFQMAGSHVTQRTASAQLRTVQASPFAQLQQA